MSATTRRVFSAYEPSCRWNVTPSSSGTRASSRRRRSSVQKKSASSSRPETTHSFPRRTCPSGSRQVYLWPGPVSASGMTISAPAAAARAWWASTSATTTYGLWVL